MDKCYEINLVTLRISSSGSGGALLFDVQDEAASGSLMTWSNSANVFGSIAADSKGSRQQMTRDSAQIVNTHVDPG